VLQTFRLTITHVGKKVALGQSYEQTFRLTITHVGKKVALGQAYQQTFRLTITHVGKKVSVHRTVPMLHVYLHELLLI
jgi:hypothetical protein